MANVMMIYDEVSLFRKSLISKSLAIEYWTNLSAHQIGREGESLICKELEKSGFKLQARNLRTPFAEIDILATSKKSVLMIEVKTRFTRVRRKALFDEISFRQKMRLTRAARWIWNQEFRRGFKGRFYCLVLVVTERGIESQNLPLLYDQN
jgi:putative endonuclease